MLVGRDAEVAELTRLLAEDRPVVVSGEAGVGKTTVLRAVAAASGRPVFEGGALSTLSWMDQLPLRRALGRRLSGGDPTAVAAEAESVVGAGVLLLDDLHWADQATLDAIALLAGRVGLITGVRRGDPASGPVLDRLRGAGLVEVALAPLATPHAADVVRTLRPDLSPATVDRVVRRTGGNPLLLRELTAAGEPSTSLRLALAARLRLLDAPGRDAFGMLALAGRPMPVEDVGDSGVKSLVAAELAVVGPAGAEVRHTLLAEVATEQLDPDERRALHGRIARAVDSPGEAARHHALAGEDQLAYAAAMQAAEQTDRPAERASHLALAAACAPEPAAPEADELRLRAARALEQAHDWAGMVRTLDTLNPENTDAQAWACLLRARGAWSAGDPDEVRRSLDAGLALVGDGGTPVEVRLLIERSRVPTFIDNDPPGGVRAAEAALALAQEHGVDVARARYLYGTALAIADRGEAAVRQLLDAISGARAAEDTSTEFLAANNLISYHESAGDPEAGRAVCREFIARARDLGLGEWECNFRVALAGLDFHAGDYEGVIARAEDLLTTVTDPRAHDQLLEVFCVALVDVGRIDEAVRRVDAVADRIAKDARGTAQRHWIYTEAALWGGRPERALEMVEPYLAACAGDPNLGFGLVSRAWARFDLGLDPGEPAPEQHRQMLYAIPPEIEGVRALHGGADADATAAFAGAAAAWHGYHLRGEVRCRWAAGEAMRRTGDLAEAVRLLEQAEAEAQKHGMLPLLGRIHRSLRAAGQRRSAPRTRSAGSTLTGRQRELLALVGDGLTNAQIAQRLGISRHTVVSQITSAAAKLGATGRSHAAALAAGEG